MNECGYVPINFYLWTLKCEFHIISHIPEYEGSFNFFPQTFKNEISIINSQATATGRRPDLVHGLKFADLSLNEEFAPQSA